MQLFCSCELTLFAVRVEQYCYRCGNQASILEVGPNGERKWNVFSAAPENDTDGPNQAAAQMAKVCTPTLSIPPGFSIADSPLFFLCLSLAQAVQYFL